MAKRAREDDLHLEDLMAVIGGPNDASASDGEEDPKEQLLKDGNAEAAWQLFLEEEQTKFWQAVQAEVCVCPARTSSPGHNSVSSARIWVHPRLQAVRSRLIACIRVLACAGGLAPRSLHEPRLAACASQARYESCLLLQPTGAAHAPARGGSDNSG